MLRTKNEADDIVQRSKVHVYSWSLFVRQIEICTEYSNKQCRGNNTVLNLLFSTSYNNIISTKFEMSTYCILTYMMRGTWNLFIWIILFLEARFCLILDYKPDFELAKVFVQSVIVHHNIWIIMNHSNESVQSE